MNILRWKNILAVNVQEKERKTEVLHLIVN